MPKGYLIGGLFKSILKGDQYWDEGSKFNPERFLVDGEVKKNEKLIPFSIGKRVCPGESLARVEIFLFFAALIQNYSFEAVDPANPPSLACRSGVTSVPEPFQVRVVKLAQSVNRSRCFAILKTSTRFPDYILDYCNETVI